MDKENQNLGNFGGIDQDEKFKDLIEFESPYKNKSNLGLCPWEKSMDSNFLKFNTPKETLFSKKFSRITSCSQRNSFKKVQNNQIKKSTFCGTSKINYNNNYKKKYSLCKRPLETSKLVVVSNFSDCFQKSNVVYRIASKESHSFRKCMSGKEIFLPHLDTINKKFNLDQKKRKTFQNNFFNTIQSNMFSPSSPSKTSTNKFRKGRIQIIENYLKSSILNELSYYPRIKCPNNFLCQILPKKVY